MDRIILEKISAKEYELNRIAEWRNNALETLRTPDLTATGESQLEWVRSLSNNERYFFVYINTDFIGYCGLDKIHLANRTAEISLLIGNEYTRQGYGSSTVKELLKIGFDLYNLNLIYGETYTTTEAYKFWFKQGFKKETVLRNRKYWQGVYYNSVIFSMTQEEWVERAE